MVTDPEARTSSLVEPGAGGPGMTLASGLWIDRPDARERIAAREAAGGLSPARAAELRQFAEQGFLIFRPGFDERLYAEIEADVDRAWRRRPDDLAYAYDGPARRMSVSDAARERKPRYRIHDLHSHSEAAQALYLDARIFEIVRQIVGEEPVAIQSLYFQYGSQQVLHRDPVVVPTGAPGHLVAAWIALEDISPRCGPLVYVPGSHRLPYYEFAPGRYEFDAATMGAAEVAAATAFDDEQMRRHGLAPRRLTARRGEVLLWHASLRHGGAAVEDERLTRRSFVVHFSTRRTYPSRAITIDDGAAGVRVLRTGRLLERDGCRGFDNPMRGA